MKPRDGIWSEWTDEGARAGGKRFVVCLHCSQRLQVNASRMKQHIVVHCKRAPEDVKEKFKEVVCSQSIATSKQKARLSAGSAKPIRPDLNQSTSMRQEESSTDVEDDRSQSSQPSSQASGTSKRGGEASDGVEDNGPPAKKALVQGTLRNFPDVVSAAEKEKLDLAWARAVYTSYWPFTAADNVYVAEFFRLIKPGWTPPSPYELSTRLLNAIYGEVDQLNQAAISKAPVVALMIDGWSDVARGSVLNVALFAGIPIFWRSIPPSADRHDAQMVAGVICDVIDSSRDVSEKIRAVVTDNAAVMVAAWREVERRKPTIKCYGCGAHVFNLLAGDMKKIAYVGGVIEENRKLAVFFKTHSVCHEVLLQHTGDKNRKPLGTVLSCATRWSTDYLMLKRNLRIRQALIGAVTDQRLSREVKGNADVRNQVLEVGVEHATFWADTQRVADLLKPIATAISFCEGDHTPVSVMPHIWAHVDAELNEQSLAIAGLENATADEVLEKVKLRMEMSLQPVTVAAYAVDPRFRGKLLGDTEWLTATSVILDVGESYKASRLDLLGDIAQYRAKSGPVYGNELLWEAAMSDACSRNPGLWWQSFVAGRPLSPVAVALLGFPSSSATVERCHKSYGLQKSKTRNRLDPDKAAKLAIVNYNLKVQTKRHSSNAEKAQKSHILTLNTERNRHARRRSESSDDDDYNDDVENEDR